MFALLYVAVHQMPVKCYDASTRVRRRILVPTYQQNNNSSIRNTLRAHTCTKNKFETVYEHAHTKNDPRH